MPAWHRLPMFEDLPLVLPRHPSKVIVSTSFGKDSVAALLTTLKVFDPALVMAHYQVMEEDWPGTLDYGQRLCDRLGVPLATAQGHYFGYRCLDCGHRYLSAFPEKALCRPPQGCGSHHKQFLRMVESVHDLIAWRERWVSKQVRACTGYFKTEVWNSWARRNAVMLGPNPVLVLGERWRESQARTRIPALRSRKGLQAGWVLEWHPILDARRIDAFRALRERSIEPHACYRAQWRELLREEHALWRAQGTLPHPSYTGQWEGLEQIAHLPDDLLDPMIDQLMYEVDEEGGPRCSCVSCFFKSPKYLRASYQTPEGKPIIEEAMRLEEQIGFTMKQGHTIRSMVEGREPACQVPHDPQ